MSSTLERASAPISASPDVRPAGVTARFRGLHRAALAVLCAAYAGLAIWYATTAPILEIGDEVWHYQVIDHLAAGRGLLVQGETPGAGIGHQEGSQPPLYYFWAAATVRAIDPDPDQPRLYWNPWSYAGWFGEGATPNLLLHPAAEAFPGSGYALAVHLLRLQSVLFGLGTLLALFGVARQVFTASPWPAVVAVGLVALNPGFLLVSAIVGNDSPAIFLSTLAAFFLFRACRTGRLLDWALCGTVAALAGLTKVSGLTVLLPAGLLLLIAARRDGWTLPRLAGNGLALAGPAVVLAGWWFARNLLLYGEPTGTRRMALIAGVRTESLTLDQWPAEIAGVWATYWGIRPEALPAWALIALSAAMLGLLGLGTLAGLWRTMRTPRPPDLPVLAVWVAVLFGLLLSWTAQTPASHGRLLFPGIAAATLLLLAGPLMTLPRPAFAGLSAVVLLALTAWASLFPNRVLAQEFRDVRPLGAAQLLTEPLPSPAGALPVTRQPGQRYGDRVLLEETHLNAGWIEPGDPLGLTLTWRGLSAGDALEAQVFLLCPGNQVTGLARVPLNLAAGERRETALAIPAAEPREPSLCEVSIGVDNPATGPLPVRDPSGQPISAKQPAAQFRLGPLIRPVPPLHPEGATEFGPGRIRLLGVQTAGQVLQPAETTNLFLFWEALRPIDDAWTVFVHLVGPDGAIVAQDDGPPAGGGAPTWTWRSGAIIADQRRLKIPADLPPGEYRIIAGLYQTEPPVRMPAGGGADYTTILTEQVGGSR